MTKWFLSIASLSVAGLTVARECDCTEYPFKPNPPCFNLCVAKLSAKPVSEAAVVKNIDPGVSVSIGVLSQSKNRAAIDFKSIQGKQDLENAALKSLKANVQ